MSQKLDNIISIEDLTQILANIIRQIRSSNTSLNTLKSNINKLQTYNNLNSNDSVETLFNAYKQIQSTSIELRKILSNFISLEVYDSIDYAFYYNGQYYHTDKLELKWLTKISTTGELKLRLNTAVKELKTDVSNIYHERIREIFNQHYTMFYAAIEGTYKDKKGIGRGGALNKGHIAEAYELHIAEHHPVTYRAFKELKNPSSEITAADRAMISSEKEMDAITYWANHEGINTAWKHIRESLGTQRGTVAGDVGSTQVKSGKTNANIIRLARFNTLKEGIESYTMILNPNISPEKVALQIAKYISEPVNKISSTIVDNITDQETQKIFQDFNSNIIKQHMVKL